MSQDTYTATEASRLLGLSTRRVGQLVTQGVLEGVPDSKPLNIRAESVHKLRAERKKSGTNKPEASSVDVEERIREARLEGIALGERSALLALTAREDSEKYLKESLAEERAISARVQTEKEKLIERLATLEAAEANKKRGLFKRS